jgi:tryptophan-rich sensory protein
MQIWELTCLLYILDELTSFFYSHIVYYAHKLMAAMVTGITSLLHMPEEQTSSIS